MTPPDVGVITVQHGPRQSIFLSQTHFQIFGIFFPLAVPRISAAASLIIDLYHSLNLTGRVVATPGSDVTVVTGGSRDHGDVGRSTSQWPNVFEQESETLQR